MCTDKIIKFSVSCCGQCVAMEQALNRLNVKYRSVELDDPQHEYSEAYKITRVPTLIKVDDSGVEIARIEGHTTDAEYKKFLGL